MKRIPKWLINEFLAQINREMFNNMLPVETLKVKQHKHDEIYSATYFDGTIDIYLNWHEGTTEFFATLAHEVTHFYQDLLDVPINHNGAFFRYYVNKFVNLYDEKRITFKGA